MPDFWNWVTRASMNEGRACFPAVTAENGKVYVFGGGTSISTSLNTIEEYSKDQDEWVVLNYTLPQPMCAMAAVELNGAIYISSEGPARMPASRLQKCIAFIPTRDLMRTPLPLYLLPGLSCRPAQLLMEE
ncbi:MAG: hypothetical protein IPJ40_14505 [Saprospirales bacterium]|nr:hypothetical protein [Saprospirales bacterium]